MILYSQARHRACKIKKENFPFGERQIEKEFESWDEFINNYVIVQDPVLYEKGAMCGPAAEANFYTFDNEQEALKFWEKKEPEIYSKRGEVEYVYEWIFYAPLKDKTQNEWEPSRLKFYGRGERVYDRKI